MNRHFVAVVPLAVAAGIIPFGLASAQSGPSGPSGRSRVGAVQGPRTPSVGNPSPVGWGSTYQAPRPGSGVDTTKTIPGLTATYGAATGGLFPSPPSDPASGFSQESPTEHPPAR